MAIPALPTIDVTYWIKKLIRGSLLVVVNPYRLFIAMSVAIGVLVSSVCAFFTASSHARRLSSWNFSILYRKATL